MSDMTDRDELARILDEHDPEGGNGNDDGLTFWHPQADAILAAGFRRAPKVGAMQYLPDGSNHHEVIAWLADGHYAYEVEPFVEDMITGYTGLQKYTDPFTVPLGSWVVIPERRRGVSPVILPSEPKVDEEAVAEAIAVSRYARKGVDARELWAGRHPDFKRDDLETVMPDARAALAALGLTPKEGGE